MFATRSGTMVCVNKVATKKIAPTGQHVARLMLASTISSSG